MRNIATTPFGGSAEQIADLGAELAEFQRQYLVLKKDRDQWRTLAESFSVCPDGCEDCKNEYEEMVNGKV